MALDESVYSVVREATNRPSVRSTLLNVGLDYNPGQDSALRLVTELGGDLQGLRILIPQEAQANRRSPKLREDSAATDFSPDARRSPPNGAWLAGGAKP